MEALGVPVRAYKTAAARIRGEGRTGQTQRALSLGERFQDIRFVIRDRGSNFIPSFDAVPGLIRRTKPAVPRVDSPGCLSGVVVRRHADRRRRGDRTLKVADLFWSLTQSRDQTRVTISE